MSNEIDGMTDGINRTIIRFDEQIEFIVELYCSITGGSLIGLHGPTGRVSESRHAVSCSMILALTEVQGFGARKGWGGRERRRESV